jgi:hypothetical protein
MNSLGGNSSQVNILNTLGGGGFTGILSDDLDADGYSILNASGYNFINNSGGGLAVDSLGNLLFNGNIVDSNIDNDGQIWSTFPAIQNANISGFQLKNLKAGSDPSDAVIVAQLSSNLSGYLPLAGGTMTGSIAMSSSNITGIDTTSTRVLNADVINGKSANIIATNSILDMGNNIVQNLGLSTDSNSACTVGYAAQLVNQTNHTISGVFKFTSPIYVNGIFSQSSDITGVDNITAISMNVDSIQANQGGGVVFNAPVVLTNPQTGVLQSIQGANSITCKTIGADTSISIGNIQMGTGGFNMFQGVISNLADTTAGQPTNAVNYQTMAGFHTSSNLTVDSALIMGSYPVISHNAPSVSGHLVNLHHFERNTQSSNTYYINADIQEVYNDHSNRQGVTFKISSGSYGGSTLNIANSHNQLFECSHPGNGGTITELAGGRGLTILNSSRIRFTGLQVEGPLVINGNWPTVNTNHVFSCCEFLSGVTLGNLSAITGFITFHKCTFAGSAITYNTGSATVYFDQCDFGNTPIVNSGLPSRIIVSNAAGLNSLTQSNYVGYGILTNTEGLAYNSANTLVTPLNATSIQSTQIEVASNPSTANALTRKLYVDTGLSGKLTSISAGDNITIDYTNPLVPVISSTGGGGGGQNQSNVGFAYARLSYTETGPLALPLGGVADFSFNIYDQHFGDSKVSIGANNQLVIQTGGTETSRTFEILVQFKLSTNVGTTNAGPIGFYMADYSGSERFLIGFFKPQAFINSNQNIYYSEKFSVTLPYSASNKTYTPYIAASTGEWQGLVTSWQVSDLKIDYHYYGHTALPSPTAEPWTPPITTAPSITAISAVNAGEINVSYSAVTGATEYLIYRSTDNNTYTLAGSTANLSFTLTGLQNATLYYVKVAAGNDEGEGPRSVASSITTVAPSFTFSDAYIDGRSPLVGYTDAHPSSAGVLGAAQIYSIGSNGLRHYFNRRDDSGTWPGGARFSPIFVRAGFPGAGSNLFGNYNTVSEIIAAGGTSTFFDIDSVQGVAWNYAATKAPFNQPYDAVNNPQGYRYFSGPTS